MIASVSSAAREKRGGFASKRRRTCSWFAGLVRNWNPLATSSTRIPEESAGDFARGGGRTSPPRGGGPPPGGRSLAVGGFGFGVSSIFGLPDGRHDADQPQRVRLVHANRLGGDPVEGGQKKGYDS